MMPYRPFHSHSRVEFIKKKFEKSFSEENEKMTPKRSITTISCKSKANRELRDSNADKNGPRNSIYLKDGTKFEQNISKTEGKVLIKRTPAFRREKLDCAKTNHVNKSSFEDLNLKKEIQEDAQNLTLQHGSLKSNVSEFNKWMDIKRSKTDTNLLKYCNDRYNRKTVCRSPPITKNYNILGSDQDISNCNINSKNMPQYSVVNKGKVTTIKREVPNLKFSESIRRALQSPLPKGPPPKKPPRTFCHVTPSGTGNENKNHQMKCNGDVNGKVAETEPDIPKLKSKLEKLEKAIKLHEGGAFIKKEEENVEKGKDVIAMKLETLLSDATDTTQSCLSFSTCGSQGIIGASFKNLPKVKHEFYFNSGKQDSEILGCENIVTGKNEEMPVKIGSTEAIYDLPFVNKKSQFETFGKLKNYEKESRQTKPSVGSLHYMCTDVVKGVPAFQKFFSDYDLRRNLNCTNQIESVNADTKLLTRARKHLSQSLSRIDNDGNDDKIARDLNVRSEKEKKLKPTNGFLVSAMPKGSSLESEVNSLATKNPLESDHDTGCSPENVSKERAGEKLTESEGMHEMAVKRRFYLSRISSKLFHQAPYWKCKNNDSYTHLFEYCLLVGLTLCESKKNVPYIKSIFPPDMKPPPQIEYLCFPDASYWPPNSEDQQPEEQYYSLVVTNENGERKFGYCRRVLPEGGHFCLPLTYCIISPHRAGGFFYKVLEELESRHGSPGIEQFIRQLYESQFPKPGERLKLKEIFEATRITPPDSDQYLSSTLMRRPYDVRLEDKGLTQVLQHLQVSVFLKVFSSLLHERKVLLLSNSLRKLSSCTEALQSVLLPFSWQHTYIPVLPLHLIEMCEAPTPYVIGLLTPKNMENPLTNINFEDGIWVDLDESKISKCVGDEGNILPEGFIKDLETSLNLAKRATGLTDSDRTVLLSEAFIRFFVQVCGNYFKFILNLPNGEKVFQKDEFIKSVTSNPTRLFLEWFTETAMFTSFIQERLQGEEEETLAKLFRFRAMENSRETVKDFAALLKNCGGKKTNKKARTLGDKIKDLTSFTK